MPRPIREIVAGGETSRVIPLDYMRPNFQASLVVDILSGSPTYTLEMTADDVQTPGYDPSTGNWQPHSHLNGLSASDKGNLDFPICAVRLAVTGTGNVRLAVLQGGSHGRFT